MLQIPYDEIVYKIEEKTNLSKDEVIDRISKKLEQLSGLVSKEGAAHIIANELGVKLFDSNGGRLQIKNVVAGIRNVELVGKVTQRFDVREFKKETREGKVASFTMGDGTGFVRVVLWNDKAPLIEQIKENDIVKITGGYVRERNGFREVHFSEKSIMEINPSNITIEIAPKTVSPRKQISELTDKDIDVELFGTIVQAYDIRFFETCPKCGKRLKTVEEGFSCDMHGSVKPIYSYVLNLFLDDGTETIRAVCFRRQVLRLLNLGEEQILAYKENPLAFEEVKNRLIGSFLKASGRVVRNAMFDRLEFITQLVFLNPSVEPEIERLKEQIRILEEQPKEDISDEEMDSPEKAEEPEEEPVVDDIEVVDD